MEWLRTMIIFTTAVGLIRWIIPSGTFEPYINYIISILTITVMLTPLIPSTSIEAMAPVSINETEYISANSQFQKLQDIQIQSILTQRLQSETKQFMEEEFPSITLVDSEVYIQQSTWNERKEVLCHLVITIEEGTTLQRSSIQHQLSQYLDLPKSRIQITTKETTHDP